MIRIEVIMAENDITKVSEGLKKTGVGGLTVFKVKGRGKTIPAGIHASKGTKIFTPEFGDKYVVVAVLPDSGMDEAIKIIRENSKIGKIFVSPVSHAIDLATGVEDEQAI
ncbi:MAG: P-II family nitrogen regulator [Nitrososphaerota archaeon]